MEQQRLPDFAERARREAERLGSTGARSLLDEARRLNLAPALAGGGVVLFPHIGLSHCGVQTAAAVNACLDSGRDPVLLIGVLHALDTRLDAARRRVADGGHPSLEEAWGIQGPGLAGRRDWEREFSLLGFLFLWENAVRERGGPRLVVRYPYLAGGAPETLPGIGELEDLIAAGAALVATADLFHHGIGYGDPPGKALEAQTGGLDLARLEIERGLRLMHAGDHAGYQTHSVRTKSDARDVGQVLRHLAGPIQGRIVELMWRDTSEDYGESAPTWVAGALVEFVRSSSNPC